MLHDDEVVDDLCVPSHDAHLVIDVIEVTLTDIFDENDETLYHLVDDDDDDFDCVDDELDDADIIDDFEVIQYIEIDELDDVQPVLLRHDDIIEVIDDVRIIETDENDEIHNDIYDIDENDEIQYFETDEFDEIDVVRVAAEGDEVQCFDADEIRIVVIIADAEWYDMYHDDEHTIRDSLLKIFAMPETFVDTEMHHADEVDEQGELKYIWYIKHFHQLVQ